MKAYMMVGVPGSGKSTWVENHVEDRMLYVVSSDAVIEDIASRYNTTYAESFQDLIGFADKSYWRKLEGLAALGYSMILDRTHLDHKARGKALKILNARGYQVTAIVFPVPDSDEWKRRLDNRPGKIIPQDVLNSMVSRFQVPTLDEGFANIEFIPKVGSTT